MECSHRPGRVPTTATSFPVDCHIDGPGQLNAIFSVVVNGDTQSELNETFLLNLASPLNASVARSQQSELSLMMTPQRCLSMSRKEP
jgi:hypothetical protein